MSKTHHLSGPASSGFTLLDPSDGNGCTEAELAGAGYDATADELAAIDEWLSGKAARSEEVKAALASFRRDHSMAGTGSS